MGTEANILNSLNVSREEIFSVASKEVNVFDETDSVTGKVYFRNGHFGARFEPNNILDQYRGYD